MARQTRFAVLERHLLPATPPAAGRHPAAAAAAAAAKLRTLEDGSMEAYEGLTPEQRYEFDVRGYYVLRGHYSPEEVAMFNAGIDAVQAVPVTHGEYTSVGLSPPGGTPGHADAAHVSWHGKTVAEQAAQREQNRVDMLICGTPLFDPIVCFAPRAPALSSLGLVQPRSLTARAQVRDGRMKAIHSELAGGQCMLSNNYYIEKFGAFCPAGHDQSLGRDGGGPVVGLTVCLHAGPCGGGGLHHGGFPKMRTFHYGYDHTTGWLRQHFHGIFSAHLLWFLRSHAVLRKHRWCGRLTRLTCLVAVGPVYRQV